MSDSASSSNPIRDILRTGFEDFARFVNPLVSLRATLTGERAHVVATRYGRLVDAEGRTIEDFHGTQSFGHRQPAITEALRAFLDSDSPSWFPSRVNPYAGSLARRLSERTGYSNAFFASSGSEAVEAALKLARAVTRRPRVLSIDGAYHGCTMGSCGLMTKSTFRCTFSGSAMACVAGHAALDLITEASIERIRTVGESFRRGLREALHGLPLFKEARGEGLIIGIELAPTQHP